MTTPAPYTRETLERIKNGAGAELLGWPQDRYERVCRQHGYAIIPAPRVAAAPAPMPAKPKRVAGNVPLASSNYVTACLTPDRSERLMAEAKRLGIRKGALVRIVIESAVDQDIIELLIEGRS